MIDRPAETSVDLARSRVVAVLNRASGGFDPGCEVLVAKILEEAKISHARIICTEPADLHETLGRAKAEADVIVLLAGDGTIAAAANLSSGQQPPLIPLPGGTMNVFSHALYGRHHWTKVLRAVLSDPVLRVVSGGRAGDRLFFVSAILGVTTRWAEAREALRRGDLSGGASFIAEALRHPTRDSLRYHFGPDVDGVAKAIAVRCPLISAMSGPNEALLAAAIDPRSAAQALELGVNVLFRRWRSDPCITLKATRAVRISRRGGIPAVLDGEAVTFSENLQISLEPSAMKVLVERARVSDPQRLERETKMAMQGVDPFEEGKLAGNGATPPTSIRTPGELGVRRVERGLQNGDGPIARRPAI